MHSASSASFKRLTKAQLIERLVEAEHRHAMDWEVIDDYKEGLDAFQAQIEVLRTSNDELTKQNEALAASNVQLTKRLNKAAYEYRKLLQSFNVGPTKQRSVDQMAERRAAMAKAKAIAVNSGKTIRVK